jgi:tetratricopeptide (TPR) repeat protein
LVFVLALLPSAIAPASAPAQSPRADAAIHYNQRLLQRNPYDAAAYYRLGDAYIRKAREVGDVTYFNLAEAALRKALERTPKHGGALRHLAYILYSRHQFPEAAAQAQRAVELDPTDGHAFGVLGDALLETGKYDEAAAAYARMIDLGEDLYSLSRRAGLKSVRGDVDGATRDLERAIVAGRSGGAPDESVAWAEWQLGSEHLALGNLAGAETRFLDSLQTFPGYHRALAGLGHLRAAQQRYAEAVDLYRRAIAVIPQPDYAAALGDVYKKIGRHEDADRQYALVEYIGRLNALNQVLYNRELAYFYADHDVKLPESLALAERELDVRRDIYAWDLLAWALLKNDRPREALAAMTDALRLGTRDARLFFHAGMIYHRLGRPHEARAYLERALATNPHFHILHAEVAARVLDEISGRTARAAANDAR